MTRPQHVVRVPLYALLVMVTIAVVSPVVAIFASVAIANRATERQLGVVQDQAAQLREEQRLRACSVYGALVTALADEPPRTKSGQALLDEYRHQYEIRDCTPPLR